MWQFAMIQLSSPIFVSAASCAVPRWIETYSRMVLPSPISTRVGSPLYFLSWFASPMEQKWKMRLSRPIRVRPVITLCAPIVVPSPISTSPSITVNGPTATPAPSFARLSTIALGWTPLIAPSQLAQRAQELGLRRDRVAHARDAVEFPDAALRHALRHLDRELVAGHDRALEARAVD